LSNQVAPLTCWCTTWLSNKKPACLESKPMRRATHMRMQLQIHMPMRMLMYTQLHMPGRKSKHF